MKWILFEDEKPSPGKYIVETETTMGNTNRFESIWTGKNWHCNNQKVIKWLKENRTMEDIKFRRAHYSKDGFMKLTIEHLIPYLPYKLRGLVEGYNTNDILLGVYGTGGHSLTMCYRVNNHNSVDYECFIESFKPILRPPSDLTKEIEHDEEKFIPLDRLKERWAYIGECDGYLCYGTDVEFTDEAMIINGGVYFGHDFEIDHNGEFNQNLPYWIFEKLYSWHFDVKGLIERGLAIDKNTLE